MFSVTDLGSRQPVPFESGHLARDNTRAELIELQKADLGRKYARVDRRPLDPPPVVLLKLYNVINPGTDHEAEQEVSNYEEVQNVGLICTVDLFPVPGPDGETDLHRDERHSSSSGSSTPSLRPYAESDGRLGSDSLPPASVVSAFADETDPLGMRFNLPFTLISDPHLRGSLIFSNPYVFRGIPEVVHYVNNFPVLEGSKVTTALVGQMVVQPNLVEYQGHKALVFVFADLAVKIEGNFILRYRVFDLYALDPHRAEQSRIGMRAECYGGPFRVYSTKEFPGLKASTELTKHLARWGVRLNIRDTERRRGKKMRVNETPPYTTKAMKRKWPDGEEGQYDGDDGYASAGIQAMDDDPLLHVLPGLFAHFF
ncbi:hypothetical protein NMY22_g12412 [Coprinellus aureogranulatus]|nr:hypothetical protein NMY22_g12412 [Coprinellus aureogranulatus]